MKQLAVVFFLFCISFSQGQNGFRKGYQVTSQNPTSNGITGTLSIIDVGPYGSDVSALDFAITYFSETTVRVTISSPDRWQVPDVMVGQPKQNLDPNSLQYKVSIGTSPFGFQIDRADGKGMSLMNTNPGNFDGLTFEDQYLEISTVMPENPFIYGLGERIYPLRLPVGKQYPLWNRDNGNSWFYGLYGSHPFYLEMREDTGLAHGVFLLNSNGIEVDLNAGSLTWKSMGGVFDFFIFVGPTPNDVIRQYTDIIGKPKLPPYWSLGYHQSRIAYENQWMTINTTKMLYDQITTTGFPLETMWSDLDYMNDAMDFLWDPDRYPIPETNDFMNRVHKEGRRYVIIADHSIKIQEGYMPYDSGLEMDIFLIAPNGTGPLRATLWADNLSYFPDFSHPLATKYWAINIAKFHDEVPIDGLWIDMNEPSLTCTGECKRNRVLGMREYLLEQDQQEKRNVEEDMTVDGEPYSPFNPPWTPFGVGNPNSGTFNMSAFSHNSILYNTHNMYGFYEAKASHEAMTLVRGLRPFVLSRSTFPGAGRYTAHWLGDNTSDFPSMRWSIPGILNFNMFGIPHVGADICGFGGNTTMELCVRWMQLGSFYPFCRNHNMGYQNQEPTAFGDTALQIMMSAMNTRYTLLPYWYTLFYLAATDGTPVARPLFFEFTSDPNTWEDDWQFLVGPALLVTPVVEESATAVVGYFPEGVWYDLYTGAVTSSSPGNATLFAPLNVINAHVRGGYILPLQLPSNSTDASRLNPYELLVALNSDLFASGNLYLDDGETIQELVRDKFTFITYEISSTGGGTCCLTNNIVNDGYKPLDNAAQFHTQTIRIYGSLEPASVTLNGNEFTDYAYDSDNHVMTLRHLGLDMLKQFSICINFSGF